MKASITVLLFLFTSLVFSQDKYDNFLIEKSIWVLEGDFGINSRQSGVVSGNDNIDDTNFNLSIAPKVGYFLKDNFALGLGFKYGYSEFESDNVSESIIRTHLTKSNSYGVFPYIKKFFPIGKKLSLHLAAETGFLFGNTRNENSADIDGNINGNSSVQNFSINISPGINYRLNNKILVQANFGSLGYNNIKEEFRDSESRTTNFLGFNLSSSSFSFGFSLLL